MKVVVTVTLDVDPEAWATDYGIEGAAAIRADVKAHAEHILVDHLDGLGMLLPTE